MKDWKSTLMSPSTTTLDAIKIIDGSALQIGLVVDDDMHLLGTVTDGDIRRGILNGFSLQEKVEQIMFKNYTSFSLLDPKEKIISVMRQKGLRHAPILDANKRIVDLQLLIDMLAPQRDNTVVLMVGGEGTRLRPLTNDCPKPMLKIGEKPILRTILDQFIEHGFKKFYFCVNYKAGVIEDYFGNGHRFGVSITYLREEQKLGTCGPLSLIETPPKDSLIVMNGDLLTKVNFQQLLDFHEDNGAMATMCVKEYQFQVPYGVVRVNGSIVDGVDEKPIQSFFVNAGIYALKPTVLQYIPLKSYFDIPDFFKSLIADNKKVAAFPIREYWVDIGHLKDFQRANGEFCQVFGGQEEQDGRLHDR